MANNNHFGLSLDTLAPTGSISGNQYYKENGTITINKGDAVKMYVWFDTNSQGTEPTTHTWEAAADSKTSEFTTPGVFYYHVVLMDDVGNKSDVFDSSAITFDNVGSVVDIVVINNGDSYTISRTNTVEFEFTPGVAPINSVKIYGEFNNDGYITTTLTAEEIQAGKATRSVTFTIDAEDGEQTIGVQLIDAAGNESTTVEDSIILDTEGLEGHLALYNTDDTASTGTYINYLGITARVDASKAADWAFYKVWLSTSDEPDWTAASDKTGEDQHISVALTLPAGDGTKTVKAKIKDTAGNETSLSDATVTLDQTAPVVTITSNVQYVSKVSGFDVATITPSITEELSGVASYVLKNGTSILDQGTLVPDTFDVQATSLGEDGEKSITLVVTDNAGNVGTSDAVIITVDTVAPEGTITMSGWLNKSTYTTAGTTASATDAGSGMAFMTCWCSTTAEDTTVPTTASEITYAENPGHSSIDWTNHAESATNYIHIKYVDGVGNASIAHSGAFGIDTVEPGDGSIAFTKDAYPSTSAAVNLSYNDATSQVAKFKVWGDITSAATEQAAQWEEIAGSKSVTLTTGDGLKNIYVKYQDTAGNESVNHATDITELDTSKPSGTITLYDTDETKPVDTVRSNADFIAHITHTDDSLGGVKYQIYGDFTFDTQSAQGIEYDSDPDSEAWKVFTYDTGKEYKKIESMYCTTGDGIKTIYVRVMDNAGNISDAISAQFTYDTTAPEVTISGVDYNRISKVHDVVRADHSDRFCDETRFTLEPDSVIQAYKVCAYWDRAAAEAGSHEDDSIPTTGGSINMSATGLDSDANISCMIRGADYETALVIPEGVTPAHEKDGAHFVVAYVQDKAGTWSVSAEFEIDS